MHNGSVFLWVSGSQAVTHCLLCARPRWFRVQDARDDWSTENVLQRLGRFETLAIDDDGSGV